MDLKHSYKKILGILSRSMGSNAHRYEVAETLSVFYRFKLSKEEQDLVKQIIKTAYPRCSVRVHNRQMRIVVHDKSS
tara:strand:+ start:180 stop:410 length:231 start_codon:yes stop_codon:yes gene_type:complete